MNKDFEKRKAAIWAKWEKARGGPIPEDFREKCEEAVSLMVSEEDIALQDLDNYLEDFFNKQELLGTLGYFSNRKKPKVSSTKRYNRCFDKRLYLVEFVINRLLKIAKRERKSFEFIDLTRPIDMRKRINWKQLCAEWNQAHPNDHMSPEVLKVRYYRAIAEKDIKQGYLDRRFPAIMKKIWESIGVPPYSVKVVFGEPEWKHDFKDDVSVLAASEETQAWQNYSKTLLGGPGRPGREARWEAWQKYRKICIEDSLTSNEIAKSDSNKATNAIKWTKQDVIKAYKEALSSLQSESHINPVNTKAKNEKEENK